MDYPPVHRELLLPTPVKEPAEIPPLVWTSSKSFWLEIHRGPSGRIRYALGSNSATDLDSMFNYLENTRPRVAAGSLMECPSSNLVRRGVFARAVPLQSHHHLPLQIRPDADPAGFLLRTLGSRALHDHDVVIQLLFRRAWIWESSFFSPRYESFAHQQSRDLRTEMDARRAEPAYHVELRVHLLGPNPNEALTALAAWLGHWATPGGASWRSWQVIPRKKEQPFHAAFATHDINRFSSRKGNRDVSATELAHLLSIPWGAHYPECSYAGPPAGLPRSVLVLRPLASSLAPSANRIRPPISDSHPEARLVIGMSGSHRICLPLDWNHLAILGRTQSGKSTLALNLVLQILAKQPEATVIVIEPTGALVDGIVSRLPLEVASDTIEIDPANATFVHDDTTMVSVPLSLIQPPERNESDASDQQRWSEVLAGDLLVAIRTAWGEESIGGRAELVLRALVQGLSLTPGSNLVDAYQILSSKDALRRFVKSAPPGPLRDFLEGHLPRLNYDFTMSSLDKVGKIATNPLLRIALCQRSHPVSFDRLLGHRLLLLNLSKAALGSEGANFLGAIYLTQLWASLQRTGLPARPVYLVLDEVHNYAVPTLADMFSEGAKFGLHVVAITQYLHRVPPRIRAALTGNVDAWLLFSLGTEDMDDAWKIVNGAGHGWHPQDLVGGLRAHEVAMAVSGDLLKLGTLPSPPVIIPTSDLKEAVARSSRRYAQPEDSEASPWLVGQEEVEESLHALSKGATTREGLASDTALPADRLNGALALATAIGDVERRAADGRLRLTARGELHLRALQARRNDGEEHVETLTELAMFLETRGIAMSISDQVAGVLLPDGQFQWGDAIYNVEVECSTLSKATAQVVRNVKKGRASGHRVLIVLPERSQVPRTLALLDNAFPELRLWTDGVGLIWRDGRASFRPHRNQGTRVWPFLDTKSDFVVSKEGMKEPLLTEVDTDPLVRRIRSIAREMFASGKTEATSKEIRECIPPSERSQYSDHHIGSVLGLLGVTSRRTWVEDARPRVYDLTLLSLTRTLAGKRKLAQGSSEVRSGPDSAGPEISGMLDSKSSGEELGVGTGDRSGPTD
jgi:hypothetical protein